MKRLVSILIILAAMAASAYAQFFVEGSMGTGFNAVRSFVNTFDTPSNVYLNISPLAGYQLNHKMGVGAKASLVREKKKIMGLDRETGDKVVWEYRLPEWSLAVFARYQLLGIKKTSFLVEGSVYIGGNSLTIKTESVLISETTVSSIGVKMVPFVTYDLSDKFSLITACNFLSLSFYSNTEKRGGGEVIVKEKGLKLGTDTTLTGLINSIKIGFIYHF